MIVGTISRRDVLRFWGSASVGTDGQCWPWRRTTTQRGYGQFWLNGRHAIASRVAWTITHGDIPSGLCVCHHCDQPGCVNPKHLFLGTLSDNAKDMAKKGRSPTAFPEGAGHPHSLFTSGKVLLIRAMYATGWFTQQRLADQFGVTRSAIQGVVENRRWGNVTWAAIRALPAEPWTP